LMPCRTSSELLYIAKLVIIRRGVAS